MMGDYRAVIQRDAQDWAMRTVRLHVAERRGRDSVYLQSDGTWVAVGEAGLLPEASGLVLPAAAIEAIALAIAEHQGHTSHADTEARVLREWLAAEVARTNKALDKVGA
jgi:hypothetical protein